MSDDSLPHDVLTGDRLRRLFAELDQELGAGGPTVEVVICGGAALALRWDDRATHDVDAVEELPKRTLTAISEVASRNGLRPDWLNHAASLFRPNGLQTEPVYEGERFSVVAATRPYLLAMKAYAARAGDIADIEQLMSELGVDSSELLPLVVEAYGEERVEARKAAITDVIAAVSAREHQQNSGPRRDPGIDFGL